MVLQKDFKKKVRLVYIYLLLFIIQAVLYLPNSSDREFLIPEQTYFLLEVAITHFICDGGDYVAAFQ